MGSTLRASTVDIGPLYTLFIHTAFEFYMSYRADADTPPSFYLLAFNR